MAQPAVTAASDRARFRVKEAAIPEEIFRRRTAACVLSLVFSRVHSSTVQCPFRTTSDRTGSSFRRVNGTPPSETAAGVSKSLQGEVSGGRPSRRWPRLVAVDGRNPSIFRDLDVTSSEEEHRIRRWDFSTRAGSLQLIASLPEPASAARG